MKQVPIEQVKKGEYFRRTGKSVVYVAQGYCRVNRKYYAYKFYDINAFSYLKKGTLVEIDFEF